MAAKQRYFERLYADGQLALPKLQDRNSGTQRLTRLAALGPACSAKG